MNARWRDALLAGACAVPWAVAAALDLGGDGVVRWAGAPVGGACPFLAATGVPCPYCGMTRAFVALAHGHPIDAIGWNAAGAALLAGAGFVAVDAAVGALGGTRRLGLRVGAYAVLAWFALLAAVSVGRGLPLLGLGRVEQKVVYGAADR
jgi:hypothetical protein